MSEFAEIEAGVVVRVIVADQGFVDSGAVGDAARWVEVEPASVGVGFTYDPDTGVFAAPVEPEQSSPA